MSKPAKYFDPQVLAFAAEWAIHQQKPGPLNTVATVRAMRHMLNNKCGGYPPIPICVAMLKAVVDRAANYDVMTSPTGPHGQMH